MSFSTTHVLAAVSAEPGLTRAATAHALGGQRARTLATIAAALEAGLVHEDLTRVRTRGGAMRSARGLYPGPAPVRPAAEAESQPQRLSLLATGTGLRATRQAMEVGAPALAAALGVSRELVYAWEAERQPVPAWAHPLLAPALVAAQQAKGVKRGREARELRELVERVQDEPGITRKGLGALAGRRKRLLESALSSRRVHEAPAWVGPNHRPVTGLYPTTPPRPAAAITGEQLRTARQHAGWSQHPVATRLGVATGTLCRWERSGEALPPWALNRARDVLREAVERRQDLHQRLVSEIGRRPGVAPERLTRGTFGRSQVVLQALAELLAEGAVHLEATPTRNAAGVERHVQGLHLGPAIAAPTISADHLAARRRAAGLSRAELARRLGVSNTLVRHWELGHQAVPTTRAAAVMDILDATGTAAAPYTDPITHSAEELEDLALAYITAHPGTSRRKVAGALPGDVRRRWDALDRLAAADLVHTRPTPTRYADGRVFTLDGLVSGPASDEPEPWPVKAD